ncbi:MAG: Uma2 family endonuclease [Labilithrix sp.]|nr:Uma2 family endonuclease [Labilithrix sp.]
MSTARRYRHTYGDYLQLERASPLKLEFSDGEIFAMAGGTPEHGALAMQFVRLVSASLSKACTVYSSDVKVRVAATDLATYPDVSIVCGAVERAADDPNAVTNPRFLVEVTSPSTEDYDRGDKLSQYKQLPSLETVLLISHRRQQVTVVSRQGNAWIEREVRGGERVSVGEGISFDVTELYAVVDVDAARA